MAGRCCSAPSPGASTRERAGIDCARSSFPLRSGRRRRRRMGALLLWLRSIRKELSCACGARVTFSLRGQRESNPRERPPRLALSGHPARKVREPGSGFSIGHPARAKRSRRPCRLPLRGLVDPVSPPHRGPGKAAGHPGPHCSKGHVKSNAISSDEQLPLRSGRRWPKDGWECF